MIIDLPGFIAGEKHYWERLGIILDRMEQSPDRRMTMDEVKEFHYLYQRTSADLAKIATFSAEPEIRRYLESLISRAYGEIHETRTRPYRLSPLEWFFYTLPRTFRLHIRAFFLSLAITMCGMAFGGILVGLDPAAKEIILPFPHLQGDPSKRVEIEEHRIEDNLRGIKMTGTAWYMTHNTQVSIFTMALGITWGLGTILMLFYNGVILGAVTMDYVLAGQTKFLLAWLSPHGVIEIPAVLIAGQAGLVLAGALIGWGRRISLRDRLREISGDLVTLIFGVALLLCWAGFVEAFISQYHEPVLPYPLKIGMGAAELFILAFFLGVSGTKRAKGDVGG